MAIKFQYNKTALQSLNKQLDVRLKALPVIKNKETALRMEVKRAKQEVTELEEIITQKMKVNMLMMDVWSEFNDKLITVDNVKVTTKKIAGVKIPILEDVDFRIEEFSLFNNPKWFPEGISILEELGEISIKREFLKRKIELLNQARRSTTQKVNLYEKVQIPGYEEAIRKIKRFLEDEENLSKSSQKIVKKRQQQIASDQ